MDSELAALSQQVHALTEERDRLARALHSIKQTLGHCLEEAALCLDRQTPNVEMALSRVRQSQRSIV
ncbi:MAG: hypothetical protein NT171_16725 [Planctomycetota bacterium]|nr:hypothetical protein [Planctomycetota bacterium]